MNEGVFNHSIGKSILNSEFVLDKRNIMGNINDFRDKLHLLSCTTCKRGNPHLSLHSNQNLQCDHCGTTFPITHDVPRFVPNDDYAESFGFQWNTHAKTQLDSFTSTSISHDRLFAASKWPNDLTGQVVLEAGSGAGRFTESLVKTGATVLSFDLSTAVDANHANNGQNGNLLIMQASIYNIPVQPRSIDKVVCLGVIQHTPDPQKTFQSLADCVRPGGQLVIDVYANRWRSVLSWKYLLRPITKRMNDRKLYSLVERVTRAVFPLSVLLYRYFGRLGIRLLPIVHYPWLGLPTEVAKQWAILDTFDMYSPAHDHPQSIKTIRRWYQAAGFVNVEVEYGPNGVVGRGSRPA